MTLLHADYNAGEGPPIVFLHGFMGRCADWAAIAGRTAEVTGRATLAFDLPGHGRSSLSDLRDWEDVGAALVAAVVHRRERLDSQVARDRQLMDQVSGLQDAWLHAVAALPDGQPMPAHLRQARWLLEEYRVSLWAQHLGTDGPISDVRLRKALDAL